MLKTCCEGCLWPDAYFTAEVFVDCLRDLVKNRKRPIFVIMDGHPVHKSSKVREFVESLAGRLEIHLLPPYAPDLNPDELVWNYLRENGSARKPLKKGESLLERTMIDMELLAADKTLIKSFFQEMNVSFAAF